MATKESEEQRMDVDQAQPNRKQGGWISFPFIIGSMLGIGIAVSGATSNIIVYLIKEFNVKSIDAAQIANIINGCISLAPLAGAIISDSYFGCYAVVAVSFVISLLGMILFTLSASIRSLRPSPCAPGSGPCKGPSVGQFVVLYSAVALMAIGSGGTRFNTSTMGVNQFDSVKDQEIFFNWFFITMYVSSIIGATAIVYIQDNLSWGLGFGLSAASNAISVLILLLGSRYYRRPKAQGSPFTDLARVVIAAMKKRKVGVSPESVNYYYGPDELVKQPSFPAPTRSFRFLNRAAIKSSGDTNLDGSIAKPWSLCTVQQVEDLKALILIIPLWSSSILLSVSIGIQASLTVLQALSMDRRIGSHFSVPAGSFIVSCLASVAIALCVLDRTIYPAWCKLTGRTLTPLNRIGLGHILNAASMAASALVERARINTVRAHNMADRPGSTVPMSALLLVVPFVLQGVAEALHFPAQVELYYQEFPKSLRSTATGMIALIVALGFYLSTAVVDVVRRITDWLPDNINRSRLDKVYWMLAMVGLLNFGYYVVCARLYKYQSKVEEVAAVELDSGS